MAPKTRFSHPGEPATTNNVVSYPCKTGFKRQPRTFAEYYVAADDQLSTEAHAELITNRKFTSAYVARAGWVSYKESADKHLILIPVRDISGQVRSTGRIKIIGGKYLGEKDVAPFFYFPPFLEEDDTYWPTVATDPSVDLYETEGEFKAAKCVQHKIHCYGTQGVFSFTSQGEPIADHKDIDYSGRKVTLIYDSDILDNVNVQIAMQRRARYLTKLGAKVFVAVTPNIHDGKTGIDDYIVARGIKKARALLKNAKAWDDDEFSKFGLPSKLEPNERAYAELFVQLNKDSLKYSPEQRSWLIRHDHLWQRASRRAESPVIQRVNSLISELTIETTFSLGDPDERSKKLRDISRMSNMARYRGILEIASSELIVQADQVDADPWLLGTRNAIVDLRAGKAADALSSDTYITRSVAVDYVPDAKAPEFERFLLGTQPKATGKAIVAFLQRFFGYCLTGKASDQVMLMIVGRPMSSKSTFVDTLGMLFGSYGDQVNTELLMQARTSNNADSPSPSLMKLKGLRFAFAKESAKGAELNESQVKNFTDTGFITARDLHASPVTFPITHKLVMHTNYRPIIKHDDGAVWRRLLVVNFDQVVAEKDRIKDMPEKLIEAEGPGILNWLIAGALEYQKKGLAVPEAVSIQTREYREDMDWLADFLDDRCIVGEDKEVQVSALYDEYKRWTEDEGWRPITKKALGRELEERGYSCAKGTGGVRIRRGLTLKSLPTERGAKLRGPGHG